MYDRVMLGLARGTVRLDLDHEACARVYEKEKELVRTSVPNWIIDMEHIGSTAVREKSHR
jgi:GrpB-like predicted nucleotidyltransferase (UPF0157 family)